MRDGIEKSEKGVTFHSLLNLAESEKAIFTYWDDVNKKREIYILGVIQQAIVNFVKYSKQCYLPYHITICICITSLNPRSCRQLTKITRNKKEVHLL